MSTTPPIVYDLVDRWHRRMKGEDITLESLLHPDCTFYSPVVFTPQRGREITMAYLDAAGSVFSSDGSDAPVAEQPSSESSSFAYVGETVAGNRAILEFETTMGGKYVNGVDIMTVETDGQHAGTIIEFKVMIRPLQAINMIHQMMASQLEVAG